MEISTQLIRPCVEKMESEWELLYREVSGHPDEEADGSCDSSTDENCTYTRNEMMMMHYIGHRAYVM